MLVVNRMLSAGMVTGTVVGMYRLQDRRRRRKGR